jgi:hypothetical protein
METIAIQQEKEATPARIMEPFPEADIIAMGIS